VTQSINLKNAIPSLSILVVGIWLLVLKAKSLPLGITADALKTIPEAAGYASMVTVVFAKWFWYWPIFKGWLVLVPNLGGTWKGEIRSSWINPETGQGVGPIEAFAVIRQDLFRLSCVLMTKESTSYSRAVSLTTDRLHGNTMLDYTYSNSPRVSVQHRSAAHEGACALDFKSAPKLRLVGKYWTERGTKGEMDFHFISRGHRQSFDG